MAMAVKELERKVTRIGKSYGVTFPLDMLKKAGIDVGDMVNIEEKDGDIILRKSRKVELPDGISADFFDVLEETMKEHGEALKGLVDR